MVENPQKEKRKVLVTGSGGMLGRVLCRKLSESYEVVGLDINSTTDFISCDITDKDMVTASISTVKPDMVIHAAAWTDVDGCEKDPAKARKINTEGTANVADTCSDLDIPILYLSTDFVFDGSKKTPYAEGDMPNPLSIYAKSKFEGEKKVSALKKYIILRTGWLYGSGGKNFIDAILNKAKKEKEIEVVNDQLGTPTYTKDLANAILKLLNISHNKLWGIYHVSNKGEVSWFDYAKEIVKEAKINNVKVVPIKSTELKRPAKRPAYSVLDNTKFEKTVNFRMRSWQEALKEYMDEKYK